MAAALRDKRCCLLVKVAWVLVHVWASHGKELHALVNPMVRRVEVKFHLWKSETWKVKWQTPPSQYFLFCNCPVYIVFYQCINKMPWWHHGPLRHLWNLKPMWCIMEDSKAISMWCGPPSPWLIRKRGKAKSYFKIFSIFLRGIGHPIKK